MLIHAERCSGNRSCSYRGASFLRSTKDSRKGPMLTGIFSTRYAFLGHGRVCVSLIRSRNGVYEVFASLNLRPVNVVITRIRCQCNESNEI